jgi:transposase-like protein
MDLQNFSKPDERYAQQENAADAFKEFDATQLYCPRCKQVLLVLPEGDKYEYLCAFCSKTVGTKIDRNVKPIKIIV